MTMPDGATLTGVAAIITAVSGLVATLRAGANRQTVCGPAAPAKPPRRRTRREASGARPGRQEG